MRLTCSFRAQFHEIEVVLNMREKTSQRDALLTAVHGFRVQTHSMHQEIDPFLRSEVLTLVDIFLQVDIWNLNRFQCLYFPSHLNTFTANIANGYNAPNTISAEQFRILTHIVGSDRNSRQSEIGKCCLILIFLFIENNRNFVDDAVFPILTNNTFYRFCFCAVNIVVLDYMLHLFQTFVDGFFIITGAILPQKVFQHVSRNRQASLYEESQILSYHLAYKGIQYLVFQLTLHNYKL